MKNKRLLALACAGIMATGMCGGAMVAYADGAGDAQETTNLFRAPGFDAMLLETEETYTLSPEQRSSTGSLTFDSPAVAKREANDNVYLELKYDGEHGFASFFSMLRVEQAGNYNISIDFKKGDEWDTTDNVGFRFFSPDGNGDGPNLAAEINAAPTGEWFTVTKVYEAKQSAYATIDSFSMWFNTMSNVDNVLMVDNIVIEYIVPDDGAPDYGDGETGEATWREADGGDVTFNVNLKGGELQSVTNKETEEEYADTDYTYNSATGDITFGSDFVYDLGEGKHVITLTAENGTLDLVINVYYAVPEIPSTTDGYRLDSTMLGGDFESYEVGLEFSDAQTEEAWGSLASYDDPGVIVDDNGNHVLRLGRAEGSTKMYSSAFCITSPDIQQGDIVTLKFAYKIVGDASAIGANSNVVFVGASNTDYHAIDFLTKNTTTREGNSNVPGWPVKYTDGENGYTEVEMSFIVDFSFMNATNSLRFLYQIGEGAEIYIDNVELIRWVDTAVEDAEKPTVTVTSATFDGANKTDITATVDLKDYLLSSLKCGENALPTTAYTLTNDDSTLTIKKEYLATLANGKYTFTITTLGGTCTFEITVSNNTPADTTVTPPAGDKNESGLSGGAIAGIVIGCVAVVALIGLGIFFLLKRKKKGAKKEEETQE